MSNYRKFRQILTSEERKQLPVLLFLMFIGMAFETLSIGLIIPMLSLMTQGNLLETYPTLKLILHFFGETTQIQLVIGGILILLGLYVFKTVFLIFMLWRQNKYIYSLQAALSSRLFSCYLDQPWTFHLQRNSAQLILNVFNEVTLFTSTGLQGAMTLLTEGCVLLGIVVLLFVVEPMGAVIVLSVLALAAWVFQRRVSRYLLPLGRARQYHEGKRIQHLQQGLGGAKDAKVLGRELDFLAQYNIHNEGYSQVSRKQKTLYELPRLWLELLGVGGLVTLVFVLLWQGIAINGLLPILGLFTAAAFRVIPSANRILGSLQNLRYGFPVIDMLYKDLGLLKKTTTSRFDTIPPFEHELTLERLAYRYNTAEHYALNDISLTIQRGMSVGFIGTSGAGKSTLVDVILGLLKPVHGKVMIDGIDIQSNLRGWQDQIGYVPQSIYLTDDTLRRNVAFGLSEELIDERAVLRAIKSAQLDEFMASLPQGLNTLVGERGVRLSGGQRQRIGIARALYHDPAILVLDEATSALDMATEKGVMEAINGLHGDKTLLIIAHRLSTVADCDWVYRMEQGRIVEAGRFESLSSSCTSLNNNHNIFAEIEKS